MRIESKREREEKDAWKCMKKSMREKERKKMDEPGGKETKIEESECVEWRDESREKDKI